MTNLLAKTQDQSLAQVTPLQLYLREIARYPLLKPEEEYELAVKYFESGDVQTAHRLVTSNLRLVVKIANDFRQAQTGVLDLIQEGNYGLMQAVKKFNPYKGVRLASYAAWWIRAYILKHLMENKSQVKIGTTTAQRKLYYNLKKEADRLLAEYDRVDPKLLAESLNVREKDVVEMQKRLAAPDVSMDAPLGGEAGAPTRGDVLAAEAEPADEVLAQEEIRSRFARHLEDYRATLSGRDAEIFDLRVLNDEPLTLQEIGDRYGVTRERARQLENRLIKRLRAFVDEKGDLA